MTFYFLPSDMVGQILNFGLPAPIDVQVVGNDLEGNRRYADTLLDKMKYVPGTADLRIQQPFNEPYLHFNIERTKAQELGLTAHDIAQNLLVSLSGSFQTSPTFWVDPTNRISYDITTRHRNTERTRCRISRPCPSPEPTRRLRLRSWPA